MALDSSKTLLHMVKLYHHVIARVAAHAKMNVVSIGMQHSKPTARIPARLW